MTAPSTSSQAPGELSCSGKHHPDAGPFLVSPYGGWTELFSYLDHDSPDYAVDGSIVIANGLEADSSAGQASDLFPAYWSPDLRQYISYDGHNGYDFGITYQPVLAAAAGKVKFAGWTDSGYGNMVLIDHRNGYVTLYGHLSKLEVSAGDTVSAGQEIGISGSTGRSSGPHLHFSVFHDCQVADPYGWSGTQHDPLAQFTGQSQGYLWLPGHDPLILNPPPNWPTYPLGLHVSLPAGSKTLRIGDRRVPPVDRLLLLALPGPDHEGPVSPELALARTEARITQEAAALTPALDELRSEGLVDSYQVIPAAAAVWVHGTATSLQLEGLDGVASLSGAEPHDLLSAQMGLAHAVLIQIGHQQAPSLWPSDFRSGLHAWRPVATVLSGSALVAGFALPGKPVSISLQRGISTLATAQTAGDPDTGGFVAVLQAIDGAPFNTRPGDVIEFRCSGRVARVPVEAIKVQARQSAVFGSAPPHSSIALASTSGSTAIASSSTSGAFRLAAWHRMRAGTLVVAGVEDAAGDHQAAAAYVPGIIATMDSSLLRGWTVSSNPNVWLERGGKVLVHRRLHPAADGTFQLDLGTSVRLAAGDILIVGSPRHHRRIRVPGVRTRLAATTGQVTISGPAAAPVHLTFRSPAGAAWSRSIRLSAKGSALVHIGTRVAAAGDTVSVSYAMPSGDTVEASDEVRGVVLHQGTATIDGRVRPGALLTLQAYGPGSRVLASARTSADSFGEFHATVTHAGRQVRLTAARRLVLREGRDAYTYDVPSLSTQFTWGNRVLIISGPTGQRLLLTTVLLSGRSITSARHTDRRGFVRIPIDQRIRSRLRHIVVRWISANGLTVQRVAAVHKVKAQQPCAASRRSPPQTGHTAPKRSGKCRRSGAE